MINVDDLLLVINSWGNSPNTGDVNPHPCGDGVVNVDDLLVVINAWGQACDGGIGGGGAPQSVEDCHDRCIDRDPSGGAAYYDCLDGCIESLCIRDLLDC